LHDDVVSLEEIITATEFSTSFLFISVRQISLTAINTSYAYFFGIFFYFFIFLYFFKTFIWG